MHAYPVAVLTVGKRREVKFALNSESGLSCEAHLTLSLCHIISIRKDVFIGDAGSQIVEEQCVKSTSMLGPIRSNKMPVQLRRLPM